MKKEKEKENSSVDKFQLESAIDTLMRAKEIQANEELMEKLGPMLKKKMKGLKETISSLDELRAVRQEKAEEEDGEDE